MSTDFVIAPWIPILCSFSSCIVSGLTSFGDAIFFHIVWAIATAAGGIPDGRDALAKAVTFVTIQSVSNVPLLFWLARKELFRAYPYGAVMGIAGCAMVPVGSSLLYFGNIVVVKWLAGSFFLAFSIWRLLSEALSFVRSRTQSKPENQQNQKSAIEPADEPCDSPPDSCTTPVNPETSGSAFESISVHVATPGDIAENSADTTTATTTITTITATTVTDSDAEAPQRSATTPLGRLISRLLPISDRLSKGRCLFVLLCAGLGAGFLGGLLGTGGPPQMIAFALMALHKDIIRAISASYNSIEIPFRILIFLNTDGNMFDFQNEWQLYLGIVLAAWTGYSAGTYIRQFADTAMILRFLLVLVFASSGILLGALDNAWLAAVYVALAIGFGTILLSMIFYPENWSRFVGNKSKETTEMKKVIHSSDTPATIDTATIVTVDPPITTAQ